MYVGIAGGNSDRWLEISNPFFCRNTHIEAFAMCASVGKEISYRSTGKNFTPTAGRKTGRFGEIRLVFRKLTPEPFALCAIGLPHKKGASSMCNMQ